MRPTFVTSQHIRSKYDVSGPTLIRWANAGKVRVVRGSEVGRRLYHEGDIARAIGIDPNVDYEDHPKTPEVKKTTIIYARVSSPHQKEDLERQSEALRDACRDPASPAFSGSDDPSVVTDIASGLNWKRKGLSSILASAHNGTVEKVVVAHRDRLARIGVELIEWFLKEFGVKLVVLDSSSTTDEASELRDDLLAITTFFVARHNGLRAGENRRTRKAKEERNLLHQDQEDGDSGKVCIEPLHQDQTPSRRKAEKGVK